MNGPGSPIGGGNVTGPRGCGIGLSAGSPDVLPFMLKLGGTVGSAGPGVRPGLSPVGSDGSKPSALTGSDAMAPVGLAWATPAPGASAVSGPRSFEATTRPTRHRNVVAT